MNELIALPAPTSAPVPALIDACRRIYLNRDQIIGHLTVEEAQEFYRQAGAIEKYLQGRAGAKDARRAARVLELAVGAALGPAMWGGDRRGAEYQVAHAPLDLEKRRAVVFRQMYAYREVWLPSLETEAPSRSQVLATIKAERAREAAADVPENARPDVRAGRFQDVLADVGDASVDLILTDPPYAADALEGGSYTDLGDFARRTLKPGGSLICYVGQTTLPGALDHLTAAGLRYWWTLCLEHAHGGQQLPGKWVIVEWKPLLWFVNDFRSGREYVHDRFRGSQPDKLAHEWAQGSDEVKYLIEKLTEPEGLVVDPFAGSGAFGEAALALGRQFIGADLTLGQREGKEIA